MQTIIAASFGFRRTAMADGLAVQKIRHLLGQDNLHVTISP